MAKEWECIDNFSLLCAPNFLTSSSSLHLLVPESPLTSPGACADEQILEQEDEIFSLN